MTTTYFDLLKAITEEGAILSIPKLFVRMFGLDTAYFLTQLLDWSDTNVRDDGFFWKTTANCSEETGLTSYSIGKARKALTEAGFLETKVMRADGSPTVHYHLNKQALEDAIKMEIAKTTKADSIPDEMDSPQSPNPIAEVDKMDLTKTQEPTLIALDIQVNPNTEIQDQDQIQDHNISSQASLVSAEHPAKSKPPKRKSRVSAGTKRKPRDVPAAVAVFQSETGYYPPKSWFRDLETITDLDRWRQVVHAWMGCPYHPKNVAGMFDCYQENRMPTTKGAKHESVSRHEAATPETVAAFQAHFAAKRRAAELEAVRAGAGPPE